MKVLLKLAVRNLLAAGLRTWLNVIVLSLTFVVIITAQGLFRGMGDQAARASIEEEFGGGQFWHPAYDPYNPLSIQDAHGPIPSDLQPLLASGQATPILIIQGTLYPQGRFLPVLIKGIDPAQQILKLPSAMLLNSPSLSPTKSAPPAPAPESAKATSATGLKNAGMITPAANEYEQKKSIELNETDSQKINSNNIDLSKTNSNKTNLNKNESHKTGLNKIDLSKNNENKINATPTSSESESASIPDEIPAFIGTRMATAARLSVGDTVILRWRDARGAFDARPIRIVHIFRTIVQSVDAGQVWIPLPILQAMAGMPDEATIITLAPGAAPIASSEPDSNKQRIPQNSEGLISTAAITQIKSATAPPPSQDESPSPLPAQATNTDGANSKINLINTLNENYPSSNKSPNNALQPTPQPSPHSTLYPSSPPSSQSSSQPSLQPSSKPSPHSSAGDIAAPAWVYRDLRYLLRDIDQLVAAKTAGSTTVYVILLFMALLAIFDTQVLSIFHRIREIGTLVALGLTRRQIVILFTLEGTLHAVLAAALAALYGFPLLRAFARTGWKMPEAFDRFGLALGERLFPVFTGGIIIGTVILIMTLTAIISYLPARKLSRLRPTEALRGKLQ